MVPIGPLCVAYVNTAATWATPTWADAEGINEFSVDKTWSTPDVRSRRTRVDEVKKTRLAITATGTFLVDPLDPVYIVLADAVDGDYSVDILILNASKETPGARGVRAWMSVNGGAESQGPDDIVYMSFELRPAAERPLAENPQRAVVTTGATPTLEFSDFGDTAPPGGALLEAPGGGGVLITEGVDPDGSHGGSARIPASEQSAGDVLRPGARDARRRQGAPAGTELDGGVHPQGGEK